MRQMAFDGIVIKSICDELQQQISGARIDKIFQPNKNNLILGMYKSGSNYALNICIDSQNYRFHLTTNSKPNPKIAPNFCMLLRKHLIGLHIKNIITSNLERIITIQFEGFDDIDDLIQKKLVVELMGKHCNIILLDDSNNIIDSIRHIYNNDDNKNTRAILPHQKYSLPNSDKINFMDLKNFDDFKNSLLVEDSAILTYNNLSEIVSKTFTGISKNFISNTMALLDLHDASNDTLETLYNYLKEIIFTTNPLNLNFKTCNNDKDYFLYKDDSNYNTENPLKLNFFIDDFYYKKETLLEFTNYRNTLLKLILDILSKYRQRLVNINAKLEACDKMQTYKLYGELITANLYRIKNENIKNLTLENYYDNNNPITIPLDEKYSPAINAKRFFKKYNKLKNTLVIVSEQKKETLVNLDYLESIVYELENCSNINDITQIYEELSESNLFKDKLQNKQIKTDKNSKITKSYLTKNKYASFSPIKYNVNGYTLLVGRNNKENDYLTLKYAKKTDIWLHTKDIHGSHGILSINNISEFGNGNSSDSEFNIKSIDSDLLEKCAKIVAFHSKAKNSSNVPVDACLVKYVKKPNGAKPGMVIYTNQITLYVTPLQ